MEEMIIFTIFINVKIHKVIIKILVTRIKIHKWNWVCLFVTKGADMSQ